MNGPPQEKPESAMTSERERLASSCDVRDEIKLQRTREFERFGDVPDTTFPDAPNSEPRWGAYWLHPDGWYRLSKP